MMRAKSTTGRQQKSIQVHTAGIRGRRSESKFGVVEEKEGWDPEITISELHEEAISFQHQRMKVGNCTNDHIHLVFT